MHPKCVVGWEPWGLGSNPWLTELPIPVLVGGSSYPMELVEVHVARTPRLSELKISFFMVEFELELRLLLHILISFVMLFLVFPASYCTFICNSKPNCRYIDKLEFLFVLLINLFWSLSISHIHIILYFKHLL